MFGIVNPGLVSLIQSILLILSGLVIIIASIGVLNIDKNLPNVVYARVHILGMIDIAGVVVFIALGQYLFAVIYLVLAPFLAHAMANAYFYGEDDYNALNAADMVEVSEATADAEGSKDSENESIPEETADAEEDADGTVSENLDSGDESND